VNPLVVLYSELKKVQDVPVIGSSQDQVIRTLLLVAAEAYQSAVLFRCHRFEGHDILEGVHIVAVPHENARRFGLSSERHEVPHHALDGEACLLATHEDGCLLAFHELRLLLLKELATFVGLGLLDKLGACSDGPEVESLLL